MAIPQILYDLALVRGYDYIIDDTSSADYIYMGWAAPGTAKSAAGWTIMRGTTAKPETWRWANAQAFCFQFVWNSRDGYSYAT